MAVTQLPIGVNKQDANDPAWHTALNSGFDSLDGRLRYTGAANPEGAFIGRWVGQLHFDTLSYALSVFTGVVGTTTGWVRLQPRGMVQMWSGLIGSIPTGWVLCNGVLHAPTGYTPPNLSGKFIVGYDVADVDYDAIGDVGGEKTHVLTVAEMPSHNHGGVTGSANVAQTSGTLAGGGNAFLSTGSHTHTISAQGSNNAHENRPPFYTLAFIAKL